jgi:hypothetical protein
VYKRITVLFLLAVFTVFLSACGSQDSFADPWIDISEHGAIGDGITDDTLAVQSASDACNGTYLYVPVKTFLVDEVRIKPGCRGIISNGGTLKGNSPSTEGIITTHGAYYGGGDIEDVTISGLNLDLNNIAKRGIFGSSLKNSVIEFNHIYNFPDGGNGIELHYGSTYNYITGNRIIMPVDNPYGTYSSLRGIYLRAEAFNDWANYGPSGVQYMAITTHHNRVAHNYIHGGTHGVNLYATDHNTVEDNHLENNSHRSVNMSPACRFNKIKGNLIEDFGSSAVNLNFGSSHNVISSNTATSYTAVNGDNAALQAQIYSHNNLFVGNLMEGNFLYGFLGGPGASYNTVEGNQFIHDGTAAFKVGVAFETDWVSSVPDGAPYTKTRNGFHSYHDIVSPVIRNNTIIGAECGVYLSQVDSDGSNYCIKNPIVEGNKYIGTLNHELFIYEGTGTVENVIYRNNSVDSSNPAASSLPRKSAHFLE